MAARMQRLNVRLSYVLDDIVAAYTDDGQDYTSVNRDELLNTSSRVLFDAFLQTYDSLLARVKNRSRKESDPASDILKDFIIVKLMGIVGKPAGCGFTDYASGDTDCSGIWLDDYPSGKVWRVKRPLRVTLTVTGANVDKKNYRLISEHDVPLVFSTSDNPKYNPSKENPIGYVTYNSVNSVKTAKYLRLMPNHTSGELAVFSWLQYPNTDLTSAETEDVQWSSPFDTGLLQIAYAVSLRDDGKIGESQAVMQAVFREYGIPEDVNAEMVKQATRGKP